MAGPLTSPWAPPEGRLQDAFRIADMIRDTGRIEAQGKYNKRMAVSDLIGGVADTAFGMIEANQQKKALQEIGAILTSGQPFDAQALVAKYGIKATKEAYSLYSAMLPKEGEPFTLGEGQTRFDAKGNILATGPAKKPTAAEQREAEKYATDQRADTVETQMRTWADEALRSGANPSDVQSQYFREVGKAYPTSMNPETPNEVALAMRAAQGDAQAAQALKLLREQKDGGRNPTEASLALDAANGNAAAAKALEMLRRGGSPSNPTEASLALAAARGDKEAEKALELMRPPKAAKPPTGEQARALGFYHRAAQAAAELDRIETKIRGMGIVGQAWMNNAWNFLQPDDLQAYNNASQIFNEARLRKESGMTIRKDEEQSGRANFFIDTGDADTTIDQKIRARYGVLAELAKQAGPALLNDVGDEAEVQRIIAEHARRAALPAGTAAPPPPPAPGAVNRGAGTFGTRTRRGNEPRRRGSVPPVAVPVAPAPPPPTVGALVAPQAAPPAPVAPPREGFNRSYDTPAPAQLPPVDAQGRRVQAPVAPPVAPIPPPPEVAALLADQPPGVHELSDGSVWRKMPNGTLMRLK